MREEKTAGFHKLIEVYGGVATVTIPVTTPHVIISVIAACIVVTIVAAFITVPVPFTAVVHSIVRLFVVFIPVVYIYNSNWALVIYNLI